MSIFQCHSQKRISFFHGQREVEKMTDNTANAVPAGSSAHEVLQGGHIGAEDLYWRALDEYVEQKRAIWRKFTDAEKEAEFQTSGGADTMALYRKVAKREGLPFKKCPTRKMFGLKRK